MLKNEFCDRALFLLHLKVKPNLRNVKSPLNIYIWAALKAIVTREKISTQNNLRDFISHKFFKSFWSSPCKARYIIYSWKLRRVPSLVIH